MTAPAAAPPTGRGAPIDLVLALCLGAAQTWACVEPWAWPLQLLAIAWLAARVGRVSVGRAALTGWAFGVGWFCAGTWWLFISMHRYGGLPAWLAVLAVVALAAFMALFLAATMAGVAHWRSGARWRTALLFASAWLLAELARGVFFTGFPW
ncbi:MAG: apolipoprotein N-acyltransferase, partial [Pseudomonadota bacterium]|nr:apolipoprotein N-acyltransferase [Pseudomonadota bacterium]